MPFAERWLDLELARQSKKDKYRIVSLTCGIQKDGRDELICKAERVTDGDNKLVVTKRVTGGMNWGFGIDIYIYVYIYIYYYV